MKLSIKLQAGKKRLYIVFLSQVFNFFVQSLSSRKKFSDSENVKD